MIATIIVGYKNDDLSISYIRNELSKIDVDNLVVVVNNASTEESDKYLAGELCGDVVYNITEPIDATKKIFVIDSKENLGFARANNLGVEFVSKHFPQVKYILFSNNDIKIVDRNVVDVMIKKMERIPDIGIITPNIVGVTGKRQTPQKKPYLLSVICNSWIGQVKKYLFKNANSHTYAELASEGFHYTFAECFFMTRMLDFIKCGMFDPTTFLYAEGLCLSERMLKIGLRYYFAPEATVIHENGTTTTKSYNWAKIGLMMTEANNHYYRTYRHYPNYMLKLAIVSTKFHGCLSNLKKYFNSKKKKKT